jgi:hypothetical protein
VISVVYRVDELAWLRAAASALGVCVLVGGVLALGSLPLGRPWLALLGVVAALAYEWLVERVVVGPTAIRARWRRIPLAGIRRVDALGRTEHDGSETGPGPTLKLVAVLTDNRRVTLARPGAMLPFELLDDLRERGVTLGHRARVLRDETRFDVAGRRPRQMRALIVGGAALLGGFAGAMVGEVIAALA